MELIIYCSVWLQHRRHCDFFIWANLLQLLKCYQIKSGRTDGRLSYINVSLRIGHCAAAKTSSIVFMYIRVNVVTVTY